MTPRASELRLADVGFSYDGDRPALAAVSLSVAPGERLAMLGANGAGKSTLLLAIVGLLRASGRIELDGEPVIAGQSRGLCARVGLVFQEPDDQLFMPTVLDDVAFGLLNRRVDADEARLRSLEALGHVGALELADRPPHQLSAGEKKRACLATVLALDCSLLLLDEPTGGLDPRGRRELAALLAPMPPTMVVATHDLEFVRRLCRRAVVLDRGGVVADGPLAEVLGDEAMLRLYGLA